MSINMQSSLDALKRQALFTIMGNMSISKVYIKEKLNDYVLNGSSLFTSLLDKMDFREDLISSAQVNSIFLLSYLDFFSLYTILYANYNVFNTLESVSNQKYLYIYSLYKDLITMIKEKTLLSSNKNILYTNFLNTKNVSISEFNSRASNSLNNLNTNVLTLPVKTSKAIKPSSIMIDDDDKAMHSIVNNSSIDVVDYSIRRSQNSMIGVVNKVYAGSPSTSYQINPEITGTVYGYFSNRIFIKCTDVIKIDDVITEIYLISSSNGSTWSNKYLVKPGEATDILIEGDINVGLRITLYDKHPTLNHTLGLTINDLWNADIKNIIIPDPTVKITARFESLDFGSLITFTDLSEHSLKNIDVQYKKKKYDERIHVDKAKWYDGEIKKVIPIFDQCSEITIKAEQNDYDLKQTGVSLSYGFDFNIGDITIYANEYEQHGSLTFEDQDVKDISVIEANTTKYIRNSGVFPDQGMENSQKAFIEYNVIIKNSEDEIKIPIPEKGQGSTVYEYIIPSTIYLNIAKFSTRFEPVKTNGTYKIYDLFDGALVTCNWDEDDGQFVIQEYNSEHSYAIVYEMALTTFNDISTLNGWNKSKKIYYTYSKDSSGNLVTMLRQNNGTELFSGNIKSFIEMRSSDKPYITPVIYEYELLSS